MRLAERSVPGGVGTLVEREDALAALHGALAESRAQGGRLALVSGEAGIGKTALVRAFCASLPDSRILAGACDPLFVPRPLGPFLDVAEAAGGELADRIESAASPHDVFVALRDELASSALVVLEDIQWADEATLDVLRLVGRRLEDVRGFVVATYRDDALERTHPLHILLGELATERRIDRIHLEPLSAAGVGRLAEGTDVDVHHLHAATSGNPFYVTEVLAAGSDEIPATVRAAVLARAAALDEDAMALLETVAVAPPLLDTWVLEAISDTDTHPVEQCLAEGVLVPVDGGVAFRHELARLVLEERLSPTRRRELHRRILAVAQGAPTELDVARLAHHAEAAADAVAVLRYAPDAARRAFAAGAYREAAAQYARALRFAGDLSPGERADLLEGCSRACYLADDQVEAIEVVRRAIECRRLEGAPLLEARALTELSGYLRCRGFMTEARRVVERASGLAAGRPEQREHAFVLHEKAITHLVDGDLDGCLELAERAIDVGDRFGDAAIAGHARVTVAGIHTRGDIDAGLPQLQEAVERAEREGQLEVAARGLNSLVLRTMTAERHALAERYILSAIEFCSEHTLDLWRINVLALAARWSLDRGRWDDAVRYAASILDDPRESPWPHHEALCVLALVRVRRGDPGAGEALADAAAVGVPPDEVFAHVDLAAARAEVAWTERQQDAVAELTAAMLGSAVASGDVETVCRLSFWRRLSGVEVEAPLEASGPFALALAGSWDGAAEEWARRQQPYEAALAQARADDIAGLRHAHAEFQRLGARPMATMVARTLRERGVRDVPRGPRASTRANGAELTTRELEVLQLIAEGLRNADIAARLVISRKTVDHHVSAILRKLEVDARGKAVADARRIGLLEDR